ncbi:MAG TPA: YcnI family protein [Pseudonocardia sp.]|jgi:uncharacterized protein YcnI
MSASPSVSPPDRVPRRLTVLTRRAGVLGVTGAVALLLGSGVASAHVTAQPGTAEQGGFAKVSLRTPSEEDTATTVKLEVTLPIDHPIPSVSTEPMPGWTATVEKTALPTPIKTDDGEVTQAVSKVTWTGGQIGPNQFVDFNLLLGPLPTNTDQLVFKTVQTYSNGDVVRWIENRTPGGEEPEHPAPTLTLTPATGEGHHGGSATDTTAATGMDHHGGGGSGGGAALTLGIIGVLLGLAGVVLGGLALRRRSGGSTG